MVTGTIKNKVDKIWDDMAAGGITNPLTVIEQLTYLMFIKSLDDRELEREEMDSLTGEVGDHIFPQSEAGQSMRWSHFKHMDSRMIFEIMSQRIFPAIKKMRNGHLPDFDEHGDIIEVTDTNEEGEEQTAFSKYMEDAMFLVPTPQVLEKVITGLDDLFENEVKDMDMQGDLYEYMLGKLSTAGRNGQFRTPRVISFR